MKKEKSLYYEKVKKYYWSVYDLQRYELNIAGFDNLDDLHAFINKMIDNTMTRQALYNSISKSEPVKERYLIIKDKIEILEGLKEF